MKRRLLGQAFKKPRKSTAVNVWARKHNDLVDKAYAEAAKGVVATKRINLGLRGTVAQRLFDKLPREAKRRYTKLAEKQHHDDLKAWGTIFQKRVLSPEEQQG